MKTYEEEEPSMTVHLSITHKLWPAHSCNCRKMETWTMVLNILDIIDRSLSRSPVLYLSLPASESY